MRRKINVQLISISIIAIISTMLVMLFVFYDLFQTQVQDDLRANAIVLKNTGIFIEENNEFIFTKEFASYVKESDMIKIMKGNIARQMFLAHPELKKELWGGHLWNPSYCAVTVSDRSREQVCSYIEGQKEKQ